MAGETAGNIDFNRINISNVDRIEIINGGASILYGSGAVGGVVNIITKNVKEKLDLNITTKSFFKSIKNLILILAQQSFSSHSSKINPTKANELNENPLFSLVETSKELESPSLKVSVQEDDDTALSSFSPEVIEVIKEEEEKVA